MPDFLRTPTALNYWMEGTMAKSKASRKKSSSTSAKPARKSKRAKSSPLKSRQEQSPDRSDREPGILMNNPRGEKKKSEPAHQGLDEPYVSRNRKTEEEDFERGTGGVRGSSRFDTDEEAEGSRANGEQAREATNAQEGQRRARHGRQSDRGEGRSFENLEYQSEDQGRGRNPR